MSCYQCTAAHVSALASYAIQHELTRGIYLDGATAETSAAWKDDPETVARVLWWANAASVVARYEDRPPSRCSAFRFDDAAARIARGPRVFPIEWIKSAHCFIHQANEAPTWEGSPAERLMGRIIAHAIHSIPEYDVAEWGAPAACTEPYRSQKASAAQ